MKITKFNEFVDNSVYINEMISTIEYKYKNQSDSNIVENDDDYKELIGKDNIIQNILERIDYTNMWYSTLCKLTGVDHNNYITKTSEKNSFWKKWAKENGY